MIEVVAEWADAGETSRDRPIAPLHLHRSEDEAWYVLEGTLVTHKGRFGPGCFVWFPEGEVMEHGASAEGDVVVVFITNKPFRIDYVHPPGARPTKSP